MTPALAALATPDPRGMGGLVGLVNGREQAFPLQNVKVRATVVGDCCRVEIDQRYANPYDTALEAIHILPLPEDGAVIEMELRAGDIVVRADCRERKEAEATFAAARQAGHRAALLTAERADVHTLRVTNIPPKAEVTVRIVVIERLETTDGRTQWRFPTTIAPRYTPGTAIGHGGPGTTADTDLAPDASRLSPPILLSGGVKLDLEIAVSGIVRTVETSLHVARVTLEDGGARVAPKGGATVDRDFIVSWTTASPDRTEARAWTDGSYTLVVVEPPSSVLPKPLPRDAVFVIDISGSMDGIKMDAGKRALSGALHGLLPGDRFRIVAFDDRIESFRPDFVAYDDATLAAADAWIGKLDARGGTVMLPAITTALDGNTPEGRVRTVLFITDGQAQDEEQLTAAVANRRGSARFFTLGIDTAVNAALLKRLARVGGGTAELCTPQDDIEEIVTRIEARFGTPLADGVSFQGGELAGANDRVLFAGRPITALLKGSGAVTVTGRTASGPYSATATPVTTPFALGPLWGRERVSQLEDRLTLRPFEEEALRGEILRIALEHHIASKYTAFVAVETSTVVTGPRTEVVQPALLPHGWNEGFAGGPGGPPLGGGGISTSRLSMPSAPPPPSMAPSPVMAPSPRRARSADADDDAAPRGGGAIRGLVEKLAAPFRSQAPPPPPAQAEMDEMSLLREEVGTYEVAKKGAPASFSPAKAQKAADPGAELARTQSADGSWGGDVRRTATALLALVLLGNTRHVGLRKRAVLKAAAWLAAYSANPHASVALAALSRVERGDDAGRKHELKMLADASAEGQIVAALLAK